MKRVLFLLVSVLSLAVLTGCTDSTLEELKKNEVQYQTKQFIDPIETGEPGEDDDSGEEG